jgi:hypothetical protein
MKAAELVAVVDIDVALVEPGRGALAARDQHQLVVEEDSAGEILALGRTYWGQSVVSGKSPPGIVTFLVSDRSPQPDDLGRPAP